ncbi:MAG: transcriptional activator protein [Cyanobacteria bacterium RYN_339]|nr:transcriptional activator protein [Cyanobacteria bacterium RYN_339]
MAPLFGEDLVTRTKFIAPAPRRGQLDRERLYQALDELEGLPLALVTAGAGYGKSSLVASWLRARGLATLWYELGARDADPQLFSIHLAHLFHRAYPGVADRALALLAQPGGADRHGEAAIEALADALLDHLPADTILVLDDFHHLAGGPALALVGHLVSLLPPRLHVVLASRQKPDLPDLPRWRLSGDVLELDQADLAFTHAELAAWLTAAHGLELDAEAVGRVAAETEGWPIALALVARRLKDGQASARAGSLTDLFGYLAREVLEKLDAPTRQALLAVAPLDRLDPIVCGRLADLADAGAWLRELDDRGLFVRAGEDGVPRLHHLFREFLLARLADDGQLVNARRAAAGALAAAGQPEEAIEQWLAAGEFEPAAAALALVAPALVSQGRYQRLASWLDALPAELVARAPSLAVSMGDACRLAARFSEAIAWYDRALTGYADAPEGRARALAGKALVFLDTLQPVRAGKLLEEAAASAPEDRRGELLVLLAENKLNQGDAAGALALFREASAAPEMPMHEARVLLRTGRLAEARTVLQAAVVAPAHPALRDMSASVPPAANEGTRAHREPALVLSLVEALTGDADAALALALQARARARGRESGWTEAVAAMREGHARLVGGDLAGADAAYREALLRADAVGVARLRAEPLMGLAFLAGRKHDLPGAEAAITSVIEAARATGDIWLGAMLALALGGILAARGEQRGALWLERARDDYDTCGDFFGRTLAVLGLARLALSSDDDARLLDAISGLTEAIRAHDYGFTLTRPTLLGFATLDEAKAFMAGCLARGVAPDLLAPWSVELGLDAPPMLERRVPGLRAPGTAELRLDDKLRVRTLGGFRVRQGARELGERAWGREKARQLFQVLVVYRGQRLSKARIIDLLWPDADPASADGTFRVALNALNKALEPDRKGGAATRFIVRDGATYGLGPEVWIDALEFERLLDMARGDDDIQTLQQALALYEGPFLPDTELSEVYGERERLAERFADGAIRLARALARQRDDAGCAEWAQRLIARDRCMEEAYRLLMIAQYRQGDRGLAIRTYDRCVVALSDELDVDPLPETQALFAAISNAEPVTV